MELTGKCKIDFEKWLQEQPLAPYPSMVWDIPLIVRNSFLLSFFDAANIIIEVTSAYDSMLKYNRGFDFYVLEEYTGKDYINEVDCFETREKALEEAIITANKIYNERN